MRERERFSTLSHSISLSRAGYLCVSSFHVLGIQRLRILLFPTCNPRTPSVEVFNAGEEVGVNRGAVFCDNTSHVLRHKHRLCLGFSDRNPALLTRKHKPEANGTQGVLAPTPSRLEICLGTRVCCPGLPSSSRRLATQTRTSPRYDTLTPTPASTSLLHPHRPFTPRSSDFIPTSPHPLLVPSVSLHNLSTRCEDKKPSGVLDRKYELTVPELGVVVFPKHVLASVCWWVWLFLA
ncbi:hypothetical protein BaRGS_00013681 [Batillaria attramentaria]|uniref:Uncharacterized protein n=1 Tax=Batillaria attramentaria TaxID=370345 RepID=A0ABD0L695_9CAEN